MSSENRTRALGLTPPCRMLTVDVPLDGPTIHSRVPSHKGGSLGKALHFSGLSFPTCKSEKVGGGKQNWTEAVVRLTVTIATIPAKLVRTEGTMLTSSNTQPTHDHRRRCQRSLGGVRIQIDVTSRWSERLNRYNPVLCL